MREAALLFPGYEALDARAGAYLLLISLTQPLASALRCMDLTLPAGTYAYAGSANGPGGIAARVARHMRSEKKLHWHIDTLTMAASKITPFAFPGGNECSLVDRLLAAGCDVPAPGFGSSDCRICPTHLLRFSTAGDSPHAAA